ncbi:type IX secretion system sortase PorU [bacterium]|nr:type IX secretion system sortase PorU [FCB group bacterium]MBL7190116.1 type IX secretion system sortase PorU [bacterium]
MKNRRKLILILLLSCAGLVYASGFSDIEILKSDETGISIVYKPRIDDFNPGYSDSAQTLDIVNHSLNPDSGGWMIPFRRHLIAIPPGAKARLTTSGLKTRQYNNIKLSKNDKLEDDIDSAQRKSPDITSNFISISAPRSFRRYQVVELILRPARYEPSNRRLHLLEEIRIDIVFQGGGIGAGRERVHLPLNDFILNHNQSADWTIAAESRRGNFLPEGENLKILIDSGGIYKIGYNDLVSAGADPADYPLSMIRMFNNGGRELPASISAARPDSLIEIAILVEDIDSDDVFDPEDFLLFYGKGVSGWEYQGNGEFSHYINHYTYDNAYWLNLSAAGPSGKRMEPLGADGQASLMVTETLARVYHEDDFVIYAYSGFPNSGLDWYGDHFGGVTTRFYPESFANVASGYYKIKLNVKRLSSYSSFDVYFLNQDTSAIVGTFAGNYFQISGEGLSKEGVNYLRLDQTHPSGSVYFDYYEIEYRRELTAVNGELYFESPLGSQAPQYNLSGLQSNAFIFKITDFQDVQYTKGTSFIDDPLSMIEVERYIALDDDRFKQPKSVYKYLPPASDILDLRDVNNAADYIMITHSDFYDELQPLVSMWSAQEGIIVKRVNVQRVFDQFAWGLYDPVAIRDFLKYTKDHWAVMPSYIALIGDGDYDYRNILSSNDKNWIPPYEEGGYCYDDFYVYLSGPYQTQNPEMAVGRYTVTSESEIENAVSKVIEYVESPEFGPWKMSITLVADDEYEQGGKVTTLEYYHTQQSEDLADYYIPDFMHLNKVYLTEYPVIPSAGGRQKPTAGDDLVKYINKGSLMVNYFGHGHEWVWAHEAVFFAERDLPRIDNDGRLAYFVAMTCDWAYFDYLERQSMPEMLLVMPNGGAIASIGATRPTGSSLNFNLSKNFYSYLFEDPHNPHSGGEALMWGKIHYGNENSEKYHVIGDPLIRPAIPSSCGNIVSITPDTLYALNIITVTGELLKNGAKWTDFDGTVYLQVFDTSKPITYQFAPPTSQSTGSIVTVNYDLSGSMLFRGPYSAVGGDFISNFIVPMDITYGGLNGRINYYFNNGSEDGCGFIDSLRLAAGDVSLVDSDTTSIAVYFGDRSWKPGGQVAPSPMLIADLYDTSGVNLTGFPGHKITLTIDDDLQFDLTDDFDYLVDSYRQGSVEKRLDYIPQGNHEMKFRVWDSFNNPQQITFTANVASSEPSDEWLWDLLNYPNPFADETIITFRLIEAAEVKMRIFTVGGRCIDEIGPYYEEDEGYIYNEQRYTWDGRDRMGDKVANGVYLYKVSADFSGKTISKIGRIVVMR